MPTINPALPADGDTAVVAPYNAAIQAILAVLNGALDQDNLANGAVILSKLSTALQQALVPAGTILAYGGAAAPSGYLLCYGQAVSRSTYSDLFAIIGTAFGVGNGTTTFNLPDLRGRVPVGNDAMGGTAANRSQRSTTIATTNASPTATVTSASGLSVGDVIVSTNVPAGTTITVISGTTITMSNNATATASGIAARFSQMGNDAQVIGAAGGTSSHTLITAQLASHTHGVPATGTTGSGGNAYQLDTFTPLAAQPTQAAGGDQPHPNIQPSQVVNYIVKV
jgi:microcystin-dependent protein